MLKTLLIAGVVFLLIGALAAAVVRAESLIRRGSREYESFAARKRNGVE